jgi:hypothetical protein
MKNKTNKQLSSTFDSEMENKLIIDALLWLGSGKKNETYLVRHS